MNGNPDTRLIHAVLNARLIGFFKWGGIFLLALIVQAVEARYQLASLAEQVETQHAQIICLIRETDKNEEACLR